MAAPDRCYWVRDEEADNLAFMVPMCIGGSVDPSLCTCDAPQSEIERARFERAAAEIEIARLRERLVRQHARIEEQARHIRRLRASLSEARAS